MAMVLGFSSIMDWLRRRSGDSSAGADRCMDREATLGTKVVGWGPCPLPGERARLARAAEQARQLMEALNGIDGS